MLGNFLFSGEDVKKKIAALSGGEKARVSLSKLMLLEANVLILDEPTNHLDLFSKEVLESALVDFEGTLLFISHDRYFLNKMAERIVELTPQGILQFLGNYDEMLEKKQELAELQEETAAAKKDIAKTEGAPVSNYEMDKQAKKDQRQRQRKLEQLEQSIAELEAEITVLEEKLTEPDVYNDYVLVQQLQADIEQKKSELSSCYEAWEELLA